MPRNQSVAAKPLDKVLIRKIRFGKKNIRTRPKIIKFDPRGPNQRTRSEENFKKLCETFRIACLQVLSFFFMTLNQNAQAVMNNQLQPRKKERGGGGGKEDTPFTDNYDIATAHYKNISDEHVENLTITDRDN